MWPEWLLDLKQIMNQPQVSVIISTQDEDFLSYMIDLNVGEGDSGQVGMALDGVLGDGDNHGPVL